MGSIHGALFVAYMILAWEVNSSHRNEIALMIKAFFASILPFGTFILDREWKEEAAIVSYKQNSPLKKGFRGVFYHGSISFTAKSFLSCCRVLPSANMLFKSPS